MKKTLFTIIWPVLLLSGCGEATVAIPPTTAESLPASPSSTSLPANPTETVAPTATSTPGPVIDAQGTITWHPQQVLILYEQTGGDGARFRYPPEFMLLWDGTLLQRGKEFNDPPFISHLDQTEVCKLLNTVDQSGFFAEPREYSFPFAGAGGEWITINGWTSHTSGAQALSYALSAAPYFDPLFCRNCPVPSEQTIIKPGLANMYFLLQNYSSPDRAPLPWDKLLVYLEPAEEESNQGWPLTSITVDDILKKCSESFCDEAGMVIDGDVAKEIAQKIDGSESFSGKLFESTNAFSVQYRVVWPYEPAVMYSSPEPLPWHEMPPDHTLTCGPQAGQYPILPLDPKNKFWSYSPDGNRSAEVVTIPGQPDQIRVMDTFGYEKFYEYRSELFGDLPIQVFPRFWTANGDYFFVNILPRDYDSQVLPFVNSIGLQRISLDYGSADYVFAGTEGEKFAYDISEKREQVVYIEQRDFPLKITTKDLYSLEEELATLITPMGRPVTYTDAGTISLSTDGDSIYVAANYLENGAKHGAVIKINFSNPLIQSIVYQDDFAFKFVRIYYRDRSAGVCPLDADFEKYCEIRLDLETGIVEE